MHDKRKNTLSQPRTETLMSRCVVRSAQRSFAQPPRAFTFRQRDPKGRANEARKRRANVRHVVGCCEELARPLLLRCKWRELFRQKFARFPVQVSPTPENVKLSFPQNVRTLLPSERAEYF